MGRGQKLLAEEPKSYKYNVRILYNNLDNDERLVSSVIVRFHSGTTVSPAGIWTQPESKPPVSPWHGLEKVDCVTEWFPGLRTCNLNIMNMRKKDVMNIHSSEFEGNNRAVRSGNVVRDELENSSWRTRSATDLDRLSKQVVKTSQFHEKGSNHIPYSEQQQQQPKTDRKG